MSAPQSRDGVFNPTSPHSSSGLADSFRGTPDTRLTAFSPEENPVKSLRAPHSVGGSTRESEPVKFRFGTPQSLNLPLRDAGFSSDSQVDRDPFVSFSTHNIAPNWKLSPTASSFFPYQAAPYRSNSSDPGLVEESIAEERSAPRKPIMGHTSTASGANSTFVHERLSTDSGLSRSLEISRPGSAVGRTEVELYITVCYAPCFVRMWQ